MSQTQTPNRRLDLLGFFCPVPVHETRKALNEMQEGELLEVHADDPETLQDIPALCVRDWGSTSEHYRRIRRV